MKTFVLLNNKAGSFASYDKSCFGDPSDLEICIASSAEDLSGRVKDALSKGYINFVVGGGDGTISEVVNALRDDLDRIRLGIIPLGTGNDFSRALGLPLDPAAAARIAMGRASSSERMVDVIRTRRVSTNSSDVLDLLSINLVSGGFAGEIEKSMDPVLKERWGVLAYARAALKAAGNLKEYHLNVRVDDSPEVVYRAFNVVVANGFAAGGGFEVAPDASPMDRKLDLVIAHPANPLQMAAMATQLAIGDYTKNDYVSEFKARRVELSSDPPMQYSVDGNLLAEDQGASFKMEFELVPSVLRVIIGKEADALSRAAS